MTVLLMVLLYAFHQVERSFHRVGEIFHLLECVFHQVESVRGRELPADTL